MWWSSDFVEGLRNLGLDISRVEGEKAVIHHDKTNKRIEKLIELLNLRLSQAHGKIPLMVLDFGTPEIGDLNGSEENSLDQPEVLEEAAGIREKLLKNNPFSPFDKSSKRRELLNEYEQFGFTKEDWENTPEEVKRFIREQHENKS